MSDAVDLRDAAPKRPFGPELEFQVLGATARRHAAVPILDFQVHVTEPDGRQVYAIALTIQLMIEPARRAYDAAAHERLVELFGPPERWGATTRNLVWAQVDVLVGAFIGATTFHVPIACSYDLELAATKYFHGLADGEAPLAFNFNGTVYYREEDGGLQMSLVPWSCSADARLPIATWRELIDEHYPGTGWVPVHRDTLAELAREKARRGLPTFDALVAALLEERR
jgi:hypothetical protein